MWKIGRRIEGFHHSFTSDVLYGETPAVDCLKQTIAYDSPLGTMIKLSVYPNLIWSVTVDVSNSFQSEIMVYSFLVQ